MNIRIEETETQWELREFVKFQLELYKDNPYFVPPLVVEEVNGLDPAKNPALHDSDVKCFLAYKNGKIVGRVAAIINRKEVDELGVKKLRFGYFDVIDDIEISRALFAKLEEIGKENRLEFMEGPMGATNLEKVGMLTYGFDKIATVIGSYNYEYYPEHLEKLGFVKEKEWIEKIIELPDSIPEKVYKVSDLVTERYGLKLLNFKTKKEMAPYIKEIFDLLEVSHEDLESFIPITEDQKAYYTKKYMNIFSPEYINLIEGPDGKLIAFAITMPSFAKALQKAKGKFLPFGWYHLMKAGKKNDTVEFVLIGVHPKFQKKGLTAIIFKEMFDTFKRNNIKYLETNPELEDNQDVQALWDNYNPELHKRRKTFRKEIQ